MYIPHDCREIANKLFTEHEQLYGTISPEKLLELLKRPDCELRKWDFSYNNYGEFYFVTFEIKDHGSFQFYGMGEHDQRDMFLRDFKDVSSTFKNEHYDYRNSQELRFAPKERPNLRDVILDLEELIRNHPKAEKPRSRAGAVFAEMADLMDEDGAYTMMEDGFFDELIDMED